MIKKKEMCEKFLATQETLKDSAKVLNEHEYVMSSLPNAVFGDLMGVRGDIEDMIKRNKPALKSCECSAKDKQKYYKLEESIQKKFFSNQIVSDEEKRAMLKQAEKCNLGLQWKFLKTRM